MCRVILKLQLNCGAVDPKERLCVQGSENVSMKLGCNTSSSNGNMVP